MPFNKSMSQLALFCHICYFLTTINDMQQISGLLCFYHSSALPWGELLLLGRVSLSLWSSWLNACLRSLSNSSLILFSAKFISTNGVSYVSTNHTETQPQYQICHILQNLLSLLSLKLPKQQQIFQPQSLQCLYSQGKGLLMSTH